MSQVTFKLLENLLLFCTLNVFVLFTMVVDLIPVVIFDFVSASVSVKTSSKALWSDSHVCIL